jgi:hypothetical protein
MKKVLIHVKNLGHTEKRMTKRCKGGSIFDVLADGGYRVGGGGRGLEHATIFVPYLDRFHVKQHGQREPEKNKNLTK